MHSEPFVILLAEDDQGHADLVEINLQRAGIANRIVHVKDGQEALDYFACQGRFAQRVRGGPLLAILDINMPRLDGVEVLARLKADEQTSSLPVIMLTTTDDPREVERCYQLGCSVYITKPVGYDSFVEAIRRLGLFLQVVSIPSEVGVTA
ncbi:MAG: rcp1 2 [Planctomycetaceae bacterium]|nr:rcp1 2 [Planctomycetaceae bacterium]